MNKKVTVHLLSMKGDEQRKTTVKTLVAEKILDLPYHTSVNGRVVTSYNDLLKECEKHEEPQILQTPQIVGG